MKALLALAILLALPGAAAADWQPAEVYVICVTGYDISSVSAAQFAIDNLPEASMALVSAYWNTDLVIGDLENGIALAFVPHLTAPLAVFGRLEFIAWEPFPDDYVIEVVPPPAMEDYLVVVDGEYNEIPVQGGLHTFNCSGWCVCCQWCDLFIGLYAEEAALNCYQDIEVFTTSTAASSWGAVKSLY